MIGGLDILAYGRCVAPQDAGIASLPDPLDECRGVRLDLSVPSASGGTSNSTSGAIDVITRSGWKSKTALRRTGLGKRPWPSPAARWRHRATSPSEIRVEGAPGRVALRYGVSMTRPEPAPREQSRFANSGPVFRKARRAFRSMDESEPRSLPPIGTTLSPRLLAYVAARACEFRSRRERGGLRPKL